MVGRSRTRRRRISMSQIIGGVAAFAIHVFIQHMGSFQTAFTSLYTPGLHVLNGLAFVIAGVCIGGLFE